VLDFAVAIYDREIRLLAQAPPGTVGVQPQVPRVAEARNMPEDRVRQLVTDNTRGRLAGLLGEPRVNVLALNLALDRAAAK